MASEMPAIFKNPLFAMFLSFAVLMSRQHLFSPDESPAANHPAYCKKANALTLPNRFFFVNRAGLFFFTFFHFFHFFFANYAKLYVEHGGGHPISNEQ
jgi:hypothetical protein